MTSSALARAEALRQRIAAAGLTLAEFGRRAGLTRNVVYRLAKGQEPSKDQQAAIERALG